MEHTYDENIAAIARDVDPLIDENDPRLKTRIPGTLQTKEETRPCDEKGRPDVRFMGLEEKLNEITLTLRATQDLVEGFINEFQAKGPLGMMSAFMGGLKK